MYLDIREQVDLTCKLNLYCALQRGLILSLAIFLDIFHDDIHLSNPTITRLIGDEVRTPTTSNSLSNCPNNSIL
jgi:hypothetical protein